ncbi:hypothetical protein [Methanosphaera sp. WGK6]|uniref:hypothetical protein n=1 Tax=Methanosphaera sp. WGK6 TaxID=1561964 RepID=UPI00084CB84D|nr:hypothetical protein [Methanosphaera sp. WGK6]OED30533.1 hypothetical protein NL43_02640 [Methanosphaera sp. WGK6]
MVICKYCGYTNKNENKYCMHCSKKLLLDNKHVMDTPKILENLSDLNNWNDSFLCTDEKSDLKELLEYADEPISQKNYLSNLNKSSKKQSIATVLSALIPGLGFCYLRQWRKGLFYFLINFSLVFLTNMLMDLFNSILFVYIMYITNLVVYILIIINTYKSSGIY